MDKAVCLVVVSGGVAWVYAPEHVDCRVVDMDNIGAGDPPEELPDIGFRELAAEAELVEGEHFTITKEG